MQKPAHGIHGRGAALNPDQRFAELHVDYDPGEAPEKVATKFLRDHSSSIISRNSSPDIPFDASLNPYRGCEHGCAYCYARPTHEYLGFSAGLDFESRIMVKENAPALLRAELLKPSYKPEALSLSGVTDPYQPIEKKLRITRGCLEVLAECRHPVVLITKNHLITRDVDLLAELARHSATAAYISITTLDPELARKLEPRASYTVVRLPFAVKDVFRAWLDQHFPGMRDKILSRIEETQGRTLSNSEFGKRLKGMGVWSEQIAAMFKVSIKRAGMLHRRPEVSAEAFRRPRDAGGQMELF